jgi:hypothetical protein
MRSQVESLSQEHIDLLVKKYTDLLAKEGEVAPRRICYKVTTWKGKTMYMSATSILALENILYEIYEISSKDIKSITPAE